MAPLPPVLAPSILAGDHANLAASVRAAAELDLHWVHVDIMDGHFVPNLSFGPQTVRALRRAGFAQTFLDVHLMLDNPHEYVEAFAKAGASHVSIHVEPDYDVAATLRHIRGLGCGSGLVLNPGTPVTPAVPHLEHVDLVLVMTVQPGFGGQSFRADMLPKIAALDAARRTRRLSFRLEVDGGIDVDTARQCREAGADTFVAGTSFFAAEDRRAFAAAFAAL